MFLACCQDARLLEYSLAVSSHKHCSASALIAPHQALLALHVKAGNKRYKAGRYSMGKDFSYDSNSQKTRDLSLGCCLSDRSGHRLK